MVMRRERRIGFRIFPVIFLVDLICVCSIGVCGEIVDVVGCGSKSLWIVVFVGWVKMGTFGSLDGCCRCFGWCCSCCCICSWGVCRFFDWFGGR